MKKVFLLFWLLGMMGSAHADVSRVEASIDKNPVMLDEAIQLTVVAEGNPGRDAFDSSALLKDFVVGRTSVSSQTSIVNFDKSQTTTWTTTLFPRQIGTYTIPAFSIEGKQSNPIEVNVIPVQNGSDQPSRNYYVTTEVDTANVYLHQQIRYTAKLYLATNIERGSLQAPELPNAQIKQIGDDKQYSDIVNGKRYQIIERNFAIIPQRSGDFTIRGPVFAGEVLAANANQRFGFFNRTQSVNRVGPDIDIEVKPVPADIDYHWLPSEFVRLDEEWPKTQEFVVGEPVTRTLTLTAMGVVEEQLPDLPQNYPPNFKLYPDQSNTATVDKDGTLIAQRVESIAIIPTQAGKFVLPEISVPWFNVLTGQTEYASLPARSIEVAPASGENAAPQQPVQPATQPLEQPAQPTAQTPVGEPSQPEAPQSHTAVWAMVILWLATLAGWCATVYYYRNQRSAPRKSQVSINTAAPNSETRAYKALETAIKGNNPGQIQTAIKHWIATMHTSGRPLTRPADWSLTEPLQAPLDDLLKHQYGNNAGNWQPTALQNAVNLVRQSYLNNRKQSAQALPTLYPG